MLRARASGAAAALRLADARLPLPRNRFAQHHHDAVAVRER
jgi:hypothetical protein